MRDLVPSCGHCGEDHFSVFQRNILAMIISKVMLVKMIMLHYIILIWDHYLQFLVIFSLDRIVYNSVKSLVAYKS